MKKLVGAVIVFAAAGPAAAIEFHFDGYGDFRTFAPSAERSWIDGGLGKTRFGSEYGHAGVNGEAVGEATVLIIPGLQVTGVMRIEPTQKVFADFIEAYARYRPVSTNAWRYSVKAGAFFAPISLENTDIGWTSPWTLTPSAINTWVGEEFRTIGGEGMLEWRSEERTFAVTAAAFGWNDPAGILIADRGWSLNDRPTGFADHLKVPDANPLARKLTPPMRTLMFSEIDNKIGWYAGASWEEAGIGKIQLLRYDNEANPAKIRTQVAWETSFWSLGGQTEIGNVTLLAQAMTGETYIKPSPFFQSDTDYNAAYLLAGWSLGEDWRIAGRVDYFDTEEIHTGKGIPLSEHGNALTFAVNYLPNDWARITAELLHIDSTRTQRTVTGGSPRSSETQFQVSFRAYLQ